jgi:hypothetical protein
MCTVIVYVSVAPAGRPGDVHVTVVVPVQLGPAETSVIPAGTASVSVYPALSDGPMLCTVTVNVVFVPAVAVAGAVFVTFRSAERLTVVVEVEALLLWPASVVAFDVIAAVFDSVPPSAKSEPIFTVTVNVSVSPAARPPLTQLTVPDASEQPALEVT